MLSIKNPIALELIVLLVRTERYYGVGDNVRDSGRPLLGWLKWLVSAWVMKKHG